MRMASSASSQQEIMNSHVLWRSRICAKEWKFIIHMLTLEVFNTVHCKKTDFLYFSGVSCQKCIKMNIKGLTCQFWYRSQLTCLMINHVLVQRSTCHCNRNTHYPTRTKYVCWIQSQYQLVEYIFIVLLQLSVIFELNTQQVLSVSNFLSQNHHFMLLNWK